MRERLWKVVSTRDFYADLFQNLYCALHRGFGFGFLQEIVYLADSLPFRFIAHSLSSPMSAAIMGRGAVSLSCWK